MMVCTEDLQANLVLDLGNTFIKLAVFRADSLLVAHRVRTVEESYLTSLIQRYSVRRAIVSNVTDSNHPILHMLPSGLPCHRLTADSFLPFTVAYSTPATLGADRLAAIAGAMQEFPGRPLLVIDAGTAITYDVLAPAERYLGGAISPGIALRYSSLHGYTVHLPLLDWRGFPPKIGDSTVGSMQAGVLGGILAEVESYATAIQLEFSNLVIILTGGDAFYLHRFIKSCNFARPNLVLYGLNYLLNLQCE